MRLVTESALKNIGAPAPNLDGLHPDCFDEPIAADALRAFLTLTQSPDLFLKAGWSTEAIFWSRYFWFRRFTTVQAANKGFDAGLEQQAVQLLEHPYPSCEPDWSNLESVEKSACSRDAELNR